MDFEYEYTVSGTTYVDLDWIMLEMNDDIENFDKAYSDYIDLYWEPVELETALRIEDAVKAEIMKRIKEDDNGKED